MPGDSVLLTQTLQTRQPTLTHRADDLFLWQRDPLLLLLASNGCESALLIPLTFGDRTPGALLLAHTSSLSLVRKTASYYDASPRSHRYCRWQCRCLA
ncbi:hypothetical protein ACLBR5_11115 [Escherichia coli]